MRFLLARYAGTVAVAVVGAGCAGPRTAPAVPDVHVTIACTNGPVNVTINGWVIHKVPGNSIQIRFNGGGPGITSLTLTPKDAARWDFTPPPLNGGYTLPNNDPLNLTMNQGATGTYRYTLTGQCTSGGVTNAITIDPDIVVD
jgi:hypothetical protein